MGAEAVVWERSRLGPRRPQALVLVLSVLFHGLVLGWFAIRQDRTPAETVSEVVEVQILDVTKLPKPPAATSEGEATPAPARPLVLPIAPRYAGPLVTGVGDSDGGVDLFGPVFADGHWPRPRVWRDCDPVADPDLSSPACRREREVARGVTLANDPRNGTDEFAREARHNEAVKRYQEAPGMAGFPGIGCHVFHRC